VFDWNLIAANTVAASLAIVNSYLWNKYWTFSDNTRQHIRQLSLFVLINLIWVLLSDTLVHFGTLMLQTWFASWLYWWQYNLAKCVVVGIIMVLNFVTYKWLIFNDHKNNFDRLPQ
jgi:putative flippase GtrA